MSEHATDYTVTAKCGCADDPWEWRVSDGEGSWLRDGMHWADGTMVLFCYVCQFLLDSREVGNSNAWEPVVTPMVPVVTREAVKLLSDVEWGVVLGAFCERAQEDHVNPQPILDALETYRLAALQQVGPGQVAGDAAARWLADLAQRAFANIPECGICPVLDCSSDRSATQCRDAIIAAAYAAVGEQPPEDTRLLDALAEGGLRVTLIQVPTGGRRRVLHMMMPWPDHAALAHDAAGTPREVARALLPAPEPEVTG